MGLIVALPLGAHPSRRTRDAVGLLLGIGPVASSWSDLPGRRVAESRGQLLIVLMEQAAIAQADEVRRSLVSGAKMPNGGLTQVHTLRSLSRIALALDIDSLRRSSD
jgi:hypothetical protein